MSTQIATIVAGFRSRATECPWTGDLEYADRAIGLAVKAFELTQCKSPSALDLVKPLIMATAELIDSDDVKAVQAIVKHMTQSARCGDFVYDVEERVVSELEEKAAAKQLSLKRDARKASKG